MLMDGSRPEQRRKAALLFRQFDGVEQAFQVVQRRAFGWRRVEDLPQIRDCVRDVLNGAGKDGAARVRVAAALEFFSDFQRFAVATAQAHQNHSVAAAEQRD